MVIESVTSGKIGVLTFDRCINYGSYWQARCLVQGLSRTGVSAVLLDHRSKCVDRAEWHYALQPLLPEKTKREDSPFYKKKIRRFFHTFAELSLSAPFSLEKPHEMEDFHLVIVGSDEVWNLEHPWYGGCDLFSGEGLRTRHIVSYAATFGSFASPERLRGRWAESLRKFSYLSVRDHNTLRLIQEALGRAPALVLDPCLQFPNVISAPPQEDDSHVAVYGHNFPRWFQNALRRWADARAYKLISIGYRNDWAAGQWLDAGPEEFASFIANARAVATNFFHGCIFSFLNNKAFACVLSDYRANKIRDLAMMLGVGDCVLTETTSPAALDAELREAPGPAVAARIAALRRASNAYLAHVLP